MPRSSSRSSSSRSTPTRSAPPPMRSAPPPVRSAPPPAKTAPPPAPAPTQNVPPPAHAPSQGGGMMSGLAATVMQGMAFGTGSAIAHRAVGAVAGAMSGDNSDKSQPIQAPTPAPQVPQSSYQGACSVDLTAFNNCMRENNNNVTACDFYYQALQQCQASNNY